MGSYVSFWVCADAVGDVCEDILIVVSFRYPDDIQLDRKGRASQGVSLGAYCALLAGVWDSN